MIKYEWKEVDVKKLVTANWNYKTDDDELENKLKANIEKNGIVQNLLIRKLPKGMYEVVNGNHRLKIIKGLGHKTVMCCDLGDIDLSTAKKIAYETNETSFQPDPLALSKLMQDITKNFGLDEILKSSPFDQDYIESMVNVERFNINDYTRHKEAVDEPSDSGGASDAFMGEDLSTEEITRYNRVLDKLAPLIPTGSTPKKMLVLISLMVLENMADSEILKVIKQINER